MTRKAQRAWMCAGLISLLAPTAPADIVHVVLNVTLNAGYTYRSSSMSWSGQTVSYDLDINGDGINELTFSQEAVVMTGFQAGSASRVYGDNGARVGAASVTSSGSTKYWATPFLSTDAIGPAINFAPATSTVVTKANDWFDGDIGYDSWGTAPDKYLAFQFNINGLPHYGWVRMRPNTFYDAAYETEPNTPIGAGEVPEPACLTLTAGAAALLLTRRRPSPRN